MLLFSTVDKNCHRQPNHRFRLVNVTVLRRGVGLVSLLLVFRLLFHSREVWGGNNNNNNKYDDYDDVSSLLILPGRATDGDPCTHRRHRPVSSPHQTPYKGITNNNNNNNSTIFREVQYLVPEDFRNDGEMYSGMWWQPTSTFLTTYWDQIGFLEAATAAAFRRHPNTTRLTRDWFDLAVEHFSKFVRHVSEHSSPPALSRIRQVLGEYIEDSVFYQYSLPDEVNYTRSELTYDSHITVLEGTIALLPIRASQNTNDNTMITLQLAATLASLWRVGIGRAVVVGISAIEEEVATQSFALLTKLHAKRPMQLQYVQQAAVFKDEEGMVPRLALKGLHKAMISTHDEQLQRLWLGGGINVTHRWKYVYYTEPDLLLHTRWGALPALTQALQDGMLLCAHRLEPIPHQRDFPFNRESSWLLPDVGPFAVAYEADPNDACCDGGFVYPSNKRLDAYYQGRFKQTGECDFLATWAYCGLSRKGVDYTNMTQMLMAHDKLLGYPLIRLRSGTGLPLVGASQRMCIPQPRSCTD